MNNNLIEDNLNLARKFAWEYHRRYPIVELDEMQSICFLGLVKAANTFDTSQKVKFSTYAYAVMKTEVLNYISTNNKHNETVSINKELTEEFTLEDILVSEVDIIQEVEDNLYIQKLYEFIAQLDSSEQVIMKYKLQGLSVTKISKILKLSVATIHKKYKKALYKLRYKFTRYQGGEL